MLTGFEFVDFSSIDLFLVNVSVYVSQLELSLSDTFFNVSAVTNWLLVRFNQLQ